MGRVTAAFTLVELLVVIAVLGVVLSLTLPQFKNPSRDTAAFALKMAAMINETGADARSRQSVSCIQDGPDGIAQAYQAAQNEDNTLPYPNGVTVTPNVSVCFDAFGRLMGAGRTYRVLKSGAADALVTIDPGYGNARTSQ